jgi:hypothetical protein
MTKPISLADKTLMVIEGMLLSASEEWGYQTDKNSKMLATIYYYAHVSHLKGCSACRKKAIKEIAVTYRQLRKHKVI